MNEEQLQRAIEFLTQSQADFAASQAIIEENFKKMQAKQERFQVNHNKLEARQDKLYETVKALAKVTHDMVALAQIHSRRLDRIEGI